MPALAELTVVLLICGVCSYGVTNVLKAMFGKFIGREIDEDDPWWWQVAFRVIPIAVGVGVGHWFDYDFPWDVLVGACGGILSVAVYKRAETLIAAVKPK